MQREIHLHGDRIYHAACLYMRVKFGPTTPRQKPGRRTRLVKTGTLCLYCGFTASNLAIHLQNEALQRHVQGLPHDQYLGARSLVG